MTVAAVVVAAGGSRRLGSAKQLLAYRGATLLDATPAMGVCVYDDGPGHPLWFHRRMFGALDGLHGDKAVWRLVDSGTDVVRVAVSGEVPLDVDTWDDYRALLEAAG